MLCVTHLNLVCGSVLGLSPQGNASITLLMQHPPASPERLNSVQKLARCLTQTKSRKVWKIETFHKIKNYSTIYTDASERPQTNTTYTYFLRLSDG